MSNQRFQVSKTYRSSIPGVSNIIFFFLNQKIKGYLRDTYRAVSGQYPSIGAVSGWIRALSEVSAQRSFCLVSVCYSHYYFGCALL